ncbi:MAG: hypothetical protein BWY65_02288 [Firmicutes bacterium ADurb.Bin373]|nr:MAG: hypothetical protein BWY65_02288 [Firmicutes bacterium ADurb.Bin373]
MNEKYIVVWIDEKTETQGKGQPVSEAAAIAWRDEMNKKYPHIKHEIRKAED